ncbi:MAG: hypothetical protein AAGD32_00205 [Planctomycetota bacterium]
MFKSTTFIATTVAFCLVGSARGATIDVGTFNLAADTPGQTLEINVTGGDAVAGVDFFAEIFNDALAVTPVIADVDLLTGTIFGELGSANQTNSIAEPTRIYSIIDATETANADGLLVTLEVDTTGVSDASFNLLLAGVADGAADTQFFDLAGAGITTNIVNGLIVVAAVPEPALAGLAGLGLLLRRR